MTTFLYTSLIRALDQSETVSVFGKKFIPTDAFDDIFTEARVAQIASDIAPDITPSSIFDSARKILAILVWMTWQDKFVIFWKARKRDSDLPISEETWREMRVTEVPWMKFNEHQYKFLACEFQPEMEPQIWSEELVLPIVEKIYRGKGKYSDVFKIRIHHRYDGLESLCEEGEQPHWYALKQLSNKSRMLQDWRTEVEANSLLRKIQHQNILPLLHSHTYGTHCNLIFPLATYSLLEFYKSIPHPPLWHKDPVPRLRFVEQISRLVPALGIIHQGKIDSDSSWIGSHRDLKPDNILVFGNSRFVISDLGLMWYREVKAGDPDYSGMERAPLGTSNYKAPECDDRRKKVGRGADIWSLGCILAEAITWCVCGRSGIEEFARKRETDNPDIQGSDKWFFSKSSSSLTNGRGIPAAAVRLKPEVKKWFEEIKNRSKCPITGKQDPLICAAIKIIESMLKEDPRGAKGRPSAEKIDCEFYESLKREAQRLNVELQVEEPDYFANFTRDTGRLQLPFSYSRSASLAAPSQLQSQWQFGQSQMTSPKTRKRPRSEEPQLPELNIILESQQTQVVPPLKKKKDVSPFIHLKRLDTMFLIDDYSEIGPAWQKVIDTVSKLSQIATKWDQDGVDLAFIHNHRAYFPCLETSKDVVRALTETGPTPQYENRLALRLDNMLSEYVTRYKEDNFLKPLNLIIITNGDFVPGDDFEHKVIEWAQVLDGMLAPKSQLGLQFVLVGCSADNAKRFQKLDVDMPKEWGVRDMVDATRFDPDAPEDMKLLEKIMCGGIIRTFDNMGEDEREDWEMLGVA